MEGDPRIEEGWNWTKTKKRCSSISSCRWSRSAGWTAPPPLRICASTFIEGWWQTVVKPHESKEHKRSVKHRPDPHRQIHRHSRLCRHHGWLVFYLTFDVIGSVLPDPPGRGIDALTGAGGHRPDRLRHQPAVHSLVIDGIFTGVGSVLGFLPIIVTLFFFLSILEDTGYMARVAFVMDKLLRRIGLSGRSIVPMLIGFGCTVPGVMATRTLSLRARPQNDHPAHPVYELLGQAADLRLFAAAFLPEHAALVMVGLYFLGILVGILTALLLKTPLSGAKPCPLSWSCPTTACPA